MRGFKVQLVDVAHRSSPVVCNAARAGESSPPADAGPSPWIMRQRILSEGAESRGQFSIEVPPNASPFDAIRDGRGAPRPSAKGSRSECRSDLDARGQQAHAVAQRET